MRLVAATVLYALMATTQVVASPAPRRPTPETITASDAPSDSISDVQSPDDAKASTVKPKLADIAPSPDKSVAGGSKGITSAHISAIVSLM